MIDVARLREQCRVMREVIHPDVVGRSSVLAPPITCNELEQLLAVFEAACAWRDDYAPLEYDKPSQELCEAIDAVRGCEK